MEHMDDPDFDAPLEAAGGGAGGSGSFVPNPEGIPMLTSMGFTMDQAAKALKETGMAACVHCLMYMRQCLMWPPPGVVCYSLAPWRVAGVWHHGSLPLTQITTLSGLLIGCFPMLTAWIPWTSAFKTPPLVSGTACGPWPVTQLRHINTRHCITGKPVDDGPGKYELHAIVSHIGKNTGSGHYVCHIKKDGAWVIFNDLKVCCRDNNDGHMCCRPSCLMLPPCVHRLPTPKTLPWNWATCTFTDACKQSAVTNIAMTNNKKPIHDNYM